MKNIIIILAVLIIIAAALYFIIKRKIRKISREFFGTDSLIQGLKAQDEQLANTPKSVSGMTKIYLPQIMKDFPEFSLPEFMQKSENQLKAVLTAIEAEDISFLTNPSGDLSDQVRIRIEDNRQRGVREHFQNIKIHRTEISRYQKAAGSCVIMLQSAVEYQYYKEFADKKSEVPKKMQTKYNMHLMYVQEETLFTSAQTAISVTCPQCGAPVTTMGHKVCQYCGAAVEPINVRVWSLTRIEEG